tara:strand:+ start:2768 stop:3484 length:717 start_codon:yes stop_codon:yes gene_type:complete
MSIADRYKDMVAEIQQLKAKNAELQEANDTFTLGAKRAIESNCKLYQENIKLEEALIRATLESGRKDKLYFKDTGKLRDENWKQIDEIKKLKETIEELEFSLGGMTCDRDKHEEEADKLYDENEKLKDFTNWENHPALKHKVVLDDDYYLEHLSDGELIHPDEIKKLKGNLTHQQRFDRLIEADQADFWACLMDCRDNPDNPTQQEIDEWCEANNKSDEVRLSIYESAGIGMFDDADD